MCQRSAFFRVYCAVFVFGLVLSPALNAAQKSDWKAIQQISQGQQIRITIDGAKTQSGVFRSATEDTIAIHLNAGDRTFNRTTISRVSLKGKGHRGRNALIGAAIGAGVGLGIGAAVDRCQPNSFFCTGNKGKAIGAPLFALLGAAIGAVLPSGNWQTIYQLR